MRLGRAATVGILGAGVAVASASGCGDLFHSTDFSVLCDTDPHAAGCARVDASRVLDAAAPPDGEGPADAHNGGAGDSRGKDAPADFCSWDRATARANAEHACAWLGSCAGPIGSNALGPCTVEALLAYDCRINPARRVRGRLEAYWACLAAATTCEAVALCVSPDRPQPCSSDSGADYFGCEGAVGFLRNASVRIGCSAGGQVLATENCIARGQTCAVRGPTSVCTGPGSADASCAGLACDGVELRDCTGTGDRGVDCSLYGKEQCIAFDGGGAACAANGVVGCDAGGAVRCSDAGEALGCPSGVQETIDCEALLGDGGVCAPTATGKTWDVSRGCLATTAACTEGCSPDGAIARGCARGAAFDVDCTKVGMKTCGVFRIDALDSQAHAACKP